VSADWRPEFDGPERDGDVPGIDVPFCEACTDNGCRECQPTRLDIIRWTLRNWLRAVRDFLLHRKQDNELPF
jgi:hypothetical protein